MPGARRSLGIFLGFTALAPGAPAAAQAPRATVRLTVQGPAGPLREALARSDSLVARAGPDRRIVLMLEPGSRRIVVVAIGYEPDTLDLVLPAGADTSVVVNLVPSTELAELVVISTRLPRRVEDQPVRVEVVETEEIEEKLLMTPGDITMLLNEAGGLRVQATAPSLGGAAVRVQGLRGRYTLLLADGLPLYGGQVSGLGPLQVPPADLARVEVIKGSAAALYGGSALGGVINLISRPPDDATRALANATTLGGVDLDLLAGRRFGGGWGGTLLLGAHGQGRRDRDGDGWTDVPGYRRLVARPRLVWQDQNGQLLFATAGATLEDRDGGTLPGRVAPDGLPFDEGLDTERGDLGLVARARAAPGLLLTGRLAGALQRHRHRFGPVREPDRHAKVFLESTLGGSGTAGAWLVGGAFQLDHYRSDAFPALNYRHLTPAVFAQTEFDLARRFSVAGSARIDRHNIYGTFLSPRVSGLFRLTGGWSLRASVGGGYYGPTPFTEETEQNGLSRLEPLAGLRAERAVTVGLDLSGFADPLEITVSGFGSRVTNAIQLREVPGSPDRVRLVNSDRPTRTVGAELLLRYRHNPLIVTGSYAYTRAREADPGGGGLRDVPLTPRHSAGLVAALENGRARVGVELYYTGQQALDRNPYRSTSRPYLILGLLVERHFRAVRVFLNFENLTDFRQTRYDRLVLPARARDGRWTTDAWAPLEGRVVNGGVRIGF